MAKAKQKPASFYVGVRKDRYTNHDVLEDDDPSAEKYTQYDYVVGPFANRATAEKRAKTEKNLTGTFTDPFCNGGEGR